MTKELTTKGNYDIVNPSQMVTMAKILNAHIIAQNLSVNIMGNNYAMVEGWQFAGGLTGMTAKVTSVENLSVGTEKKWRADVEIIRLKDNQLIGTGTAICSNLENKKKSFDEYAICSMAQTRAVGKAYRNTIGWVMKMAGYEATPSEEMVGVDNKPKSNTNTQVKTKTTAQRQTVATKATQIDYVAQLKLKLIKMGTKTKKEAENFTAEQALDVLNKKAGIRWKTFKGKSQKQAQEAINSILI